MYLAKIYITLKPTVNDPQGLTIKGALKTLGFSSAIDVRAGKYIEIHLDEQTRDAAESRTREMCRQLLANPVIENYKYEVQETQQSSAPVTD